MSRVEIVRSLNRTLGRSMIKAAATRNLPGEHVGVLAWNRSVYYLDSRLRGNDGNDWKLPPLPAR